MFEQLFSARWIEKKPWYAFLLGVGYTVLGIFSAFVVFPENIGLMSIAFTSLLVVLSLNSLLSIEENKEIRQKSLSLKMLFKDHKDIIQIYIFLFLGMMLVYSFFTITLPDFSVQNIFASQLDPLYKVGSATRWGYFFDILTNNFAVLFICLLLSLIYGAGSVLFLTWNASVWGSIFGFLAKQSAVAVGKNPFVVFGLLFVKVFPHMIVEAMGYFLAIIAGGVISKAIIREKQGNNKFHKVFKDGMLFFGIAIILLILAAVLESFVFPLIHV